MSVRNPNFLTWQIFNVHKYSDPWFPYFMMAMVLYMLGGMVGGLFIDPAIIGNTTAAIAIWVFTAASPFIIGNVGRIHPLYSVPKGSGYGSSDKRNLYREAEFYLKCSKAEKESYPSDIIDIVSDKYLTSMQREDIYKSMRGISTRIRQKREMISRLNAKHIDVSFALERMEQQRKALDSDISVYRELT